jgi:hypothetical protein
MYGKVDYDPLMDAFRCEICGKWFKGLGYHISKKHQMTVDEYKEHFGIERSASLLSKEYKEKKRKAVFETGSVNNLIAGKPHRFKSGNDERRKYKRRPQTLAKLERARTKAIKIIKHKTK